MQIFYERYIKTVRTPKIPKNVSKTSTHFCCFRAALQMRFTFRMLVSDLESKNIEMFALRLWVFESMKRNMNHFPTKFSLYAKQINHIHSKLNRALEHWEMFCVINTCNIFKAKPKVTKEHKCTSCKKCEEKYSSRSCLIHYQQSEILITVHLVLHMTEESLLFWGSRSN